MRDRLPLLRGFYEGTPKANICDSSWSTNSPPCGTRVLHQPTITVQFGDKGAVDRFALLQSFDHVEVFRLCGVYDLAKEKLCVRLAIGEKGEVLLLHSRVHRELLA